MMELQIKAQANNVAELLIYGYIGGWDNDSGEFARQLKNLSAEVLKIRINSGGGSLIDGVAIHNSLKQYKGRIMVYIDGYAASAASIIAMAGHEIIMPSNTWMMIHNSWVYTSGNAENLTQEAALLSELDNAMAKTYVAKTGLDIEVVKQMMSEETWLSADKALELGFATSIAEETKIAASINDKKVMINGIEFRNLPEKMLSGFKPQQELVINDPLLAEVVIPQASPLTNNKEFESMDLEKLKAAHPELYKQIAASSFKEGELAECERIKSIIELEMQGHQDICRKAMFETRISAAEVAMTIIKAEKQQRENYTNLVKADVAEVNKVSASSTTEIPHQDADALSDEFMQAFKARVNKGIINAN